MCAEGVTSLVTLKIMKIMLCSQFLRAAPTGPFPLLCSKQPRIRSEHQNKIHATERKRIHQNTIHALKLVYTFVSKSLGELRYTLRGPMCHLCFSEKDSEHFDSTFFTPKHKHPCMYHSKRFAPKQVWSTRHLPIYQFVKLWTQPI